MVTSAGPRHAGRPEHWAPRKDPAREMELKMKKTPLQTVKEKFGGREKLVGELVGMVEKMNGDDSDDAVKSRLMGLSNKKLLRLYTVEQKVREKFGDKAKLVSHIMDARKAAGYTADATFQGKLEGYSKARLLDMTRMTYPKAATKLTAEQRMATKRGKKQKARAQAKAGA